jgi:hypothetical protein
MLIDFKNVYYIMIASTHTYICSCTTNAVAKKIKREYILHSI